MKLDEHFIDLQSRLRTEEHWKPINSVSHFVARKKQREELERQIISAEQEVHLLRRRFERLPALPDPHWHKRAQSLLNNPTSCILIVSTVFPGESSSIAQLFIMGPAGGVRLSQCVASGYQLTGEERHMLGLTAQDLQGAVSLAEVWPTLLAELQGCYIVAYNLEQVRRILAKAAAEHDLEQPVLIGECLLKLCLQYYRTSGLTGLASLCEYIGYPLPAYPTALDRARGQLRLLQAMAASVCP